MIVGREPELARLAQVIEAARAGRGGAVLVEGEAGIGKSHLAAAAAPSDALRLQGTEAERELPFAAVNILATRLSTHVQALSAPHREAVEKVLGLRSGPRPPALVLGAALLAVLAAAGDESPLVIVIDDLQWVDRSSRDLLLFVARRLEGEAVAMIFTVRSGSETDLSAGGLPRLVLAGLSTDHARALLPAVQPQVTAVLVEQTGGNPLALLEAVSTLSAEEAAGIRRLPARVAATSPEETYAERLASLAPGPRAAARLAALVGDAPVAVLYRALALAELTTAELTPVEALGMLTVEDVARWRHPLARSAAARGFTADIMSAHRLLAMAWETSSPSHPARAWHLAEAAEGPDREAATAMTSVAELAESRGASAEAAEAFARAAALTPASPGRTALLERAALAATRAGATRWAAELLDEALMNQSGQAATATLLHARARIEHTLGQPEQALQLFFQAVDVADDHRLRVWAATEAVLSAMFADRSDLAARAATLAEHYHDASSPEQTFLATYAAGIAARLTGDQARCRSLMDQAMALMRRHTLLDSHLDLLLFAVASELHAGRDVPLASDELAALDRMRLDGDLTWLPRVIRLAAARQLRVGKWTEAYAHFEEAELLSRLSGQATMVAEALLFLAEIDAYQGTAEQCRSRLQEARHLIERHHLAWQVSSLDGIEGFLLLGLGENARAAALFRSCMSGSLPPPNVLLEVLDAVRLTDSLQAAQREREVHAQALPSPYDALAAAIISEDDVAAAEGLASGVTELGAPWERGRWLLSAGERLRRAGERRAARTQLRQAQELFRTIGAAPWLARAEAELRASGATLRSSPGHAELTPSEQRIARLVAEGRSNKEVAALLFLSPKTVEFHLGRIYRKLEVGNRTELSRRIG